MANTFQALDADEAGQLAELIGGTVIQRDAGLIVSGEPSLAMLRSCITDFQLGAGRRETLYKYFTRQHAIAQRTRAKGLPNNKLVHDFPGYIVAMATGYLVGNQVSYSDPGQEEAVKVLQDAYSRDSMDSVDSEIATEASVYGTGVEIDYTGADSMPHAAMVDRRQAFVVYDATVEQAPLFGVYWLPKFSETGQKEGIKAWVYTASQVIPYEGADVQSLAEVQADPARKVEGRKDHFFGVVPLIEYWNNPQQTGDFEKVISLIDAYDMLQSDRVNDKSQFVDALLVLYGVQGGIAPPADVNDNRTAAQRIRDDKLLQMPLNAKAEWLAKQLDEADVEVLKDAIKSDIHKFSQVPDLTDQEFASNASGVAMKYKLLGLESLTKIKERWFREGLRWRLRAFCNVLRAAGKLTKVDADAVAMTFTRALPVNEAEIATMVKDLQGLVPDELLLQQVPFVSDVKSALKMLEKQKAAAAELQKKAFGGGYPDANDDGAAEPKTGEPGAGKKGKGKAAGNANRNSGAGEQPPPGEE